MLQLLDLVQKAKLMQSRECQTGDEGNAVMQLETHLHHLVHSSIQSFLQYFGLRI